MTRTIGVKDETYLLILEKQTEMFKNNKTKPDITELASNAIESGFKEQKLSELLDSRIKNLIEVNEKLRNDYNKLKESDTNMRRKI